MIELKLLDNEFENNGITHTRNIARAVVLDGNKVMLLRVKRNDEFGKATYLETSGGGIDAGETPEVAVLREIDEELGKKVEIITKLGIIDDYYNKIGRHNINHYFLVKIVGDTKIHHVSKGDDLIDSILSLDIEDILAEYKKPREEKIKRIVYNREEPIILEAYRYMKEENLIWKKTDVHIAKKENS